MKAAYEKALIENAALTAELERVAAELAQTRETLDASMRNAATLLAECDRLRAENARILAVWPDESGPWVIEDGGAWLIFDPRDTGLIGPYPSRTAAARAAVELGPGGRRPNPALEPPLHPRPQRR